MPPKRKFETDKIPAARVKTKSLRTGRWTFSKLCEVRQSPDHSMTVTVTAAASEESATASRVPFEVPLTSDCCDTTSHKGKARPSYSTKKQQRLDRWENLKPCMLSVATETCSPSQHRCGVCEVAEDLPHIIRCLDCGTMAYYCTQHYVDYHRFSPFHSPEIWRVSCGQIYIHVVLANRMAHHPSIQVSTPSIHVTCQYYRFTTYVFLYVL